jgi:hypothetical protein
MFVWRVSREGKTVSYPCWGTGQGESFSGEFNAALLGGCTAFGIASSKTPKQWHGVLTLKVQVWVRLTLDEQCTTNISECPLIVP